MELRRNFGQTAALQAGLTAAAGDIIISMDADLQHFPEDLPQFLAKLEEGYDIVCGWRHQRRENALRRWPSRAANALIRNVTGLPIHDFGTTYRAYRSDRASSEAAGGAASVRSCSGSHGGRESRRDSHREREATSRRLELRNRADVKRSARHSLPVLRQAVTWPVLSKHSANWRWLSSRWGSSSSRH